MSDPLTHQAAAGLAGETAAETATDQSAGRALPRALTPFRSASYRKLAVALVLQTFASGVWVVALVWEVIRIGGGAAQLSIVSTSAAVGIMLPLLIGGVVADRIPQKSTLLVVATVELAGMSAATLLSLADLTQVWHLATISFVSGVGMAFYYPAYSAWLPAMIPEEDLMAVNGFEGMIRPTIGEAVGPGIAGVVVASASPATAFAIAAISSAAGVVALTAVPKTPVHRDLEDSEEHPVRAAMTDIAEGFRYMVRTGWLLATLLFASLMILVIMGPLEVLVPFLIKDKLGGGPSDHALVLVAFGVGSAIGALAMASRPMPRRYLTVMNLMWGVGCLPFLVMGRTSHIWVVIACGFVIGVLFSAPMVIWGTLLQRRVPMDLLGRVSSLDFFVSVSLMPVSMALAGPVADAIGLRTTFLIAGVAPTVFAVAAIVLWRLPEDEIAHPLS
ncbi:MAG: MFS transporter [Marmoricola sp.]